MTASWWYRVPIIASWQRGGLGVRKGRAVTFRPDGDATAKRAHAMHALKARPRGWDVGGCVEVEIVYCRVTGHARDTDRVTNLVLDALKGVAYLDDNDCRILKSGSERLWEQGLVDVDRTGRTPLQPLCDGETLVIVRRREGPPKAKRRAA